MSAPYTEAADAINQPDMLISGPEFRKMLRNLLAMPADFPTDDQAENYILSNPFGVARVIERGVHVQSFFGDKYVPVPA